jgi:aflatoxin B1 aldehyde reductase
MLGDLDWQKRGIVMDTKFYPTRGKGMPPAPDAPEGGWSHEPEHLRKALMKSMKALKTDKLDMWYLHGPDRTTPFEKTLKGVNELYKEGHFKQFAISNFQGVLKYAHGRIPSYTVHSLGSGDDL